ncbi:16S rRNA (guanine(966)-N(2))-methyltransferase RsmD [Clostridium sp. NSJ-6]|uniref:16S rRNA (Guanine(966)-N(2))-methyltransferase RsmD n=1 Tax=Clostridium hominis TaxID=2763036 RepID=A0ABR7DAP7_9CLOT|nr:16S rRNA (guanine(966)-N(2))-methyltransferase RsmD [Clostridium hominis]MBC5628461.1 16S rRNA (guanine(966)-N(2))-methyltransferase RsmD [Clostridium hominis]
MIELKCYKKGGIRVRIIAGKARGRKLIPPATMETRPTLDRVKESMFSMIQNYIPDAVVVDVFAGTGSLGLEAASRGAKEVYLVDRSKDAFSLLKQNIENLKFEDTCYALNKDSYEALRYLSDRNKLFDVIFVDPPYCREMIPEAIKIIYDKKILSKDGIIVTKIDSIEEIYKGYEEISLIKSRKYGNTTICLYKYEE